MSNKPRGLGRGLEALMGNVPTADQFRKPVGYINKEVAGTRPVSEADILRIPMDLIEANPFQPRTNFDPDALDELAASIRSLGLIQPITVRRVASGNYQIISGERRFRACRMAGMTMIPAYVREASDQGMLEMAIVENIQRQDLDPIEVALSFQRLIDECSLTQEQMADRVGKKRATVTNALRLLKLPVKVQHDLKVGLISPGHAKALLGIDDPVLQVRLCDMVITQNLSVRELEDLVRRCKSGEVPKVTVRKPEEPLPEQYNRLLSRVGKFFAQDISLKRNASGKGTMTVRFNSDSEVAAFLKALEEAGI
ncbi:MAG: ParB/RepB/Spo0J family partition protein [Bacteroidales bacterium]|nr:ParB/RepB/Spo0J family partition protein [Bacteroidales bacterium]